MQQFQKVFSDFFKSEMHIGCELIKIISPRTTTHTLRPLAILAMPRMRWTLLLPDYLEGACSAYDIPPYVISMDPIGAPLLFNPNR